MNKSELDEDSRPSYKVIIVGKSHVGKTKLLTRYKFGAFEETGSTTVGVDSHLVNKKEARFRYYDTAGQDIYRAIVHTYYRNSDACVICYDVNDPGTVEEIGYYEKKVHELVPECLMFVVGCKADLPSKIDENKIRSQYPTASFHLASAKNNTNVEETFAFIESQLVRKKLKQRKNYHSLEITTDKKKPKPPCCKNY